VTSPNSPKERTQSVPYVALGDSLTAGAQSLGVAAISQRYSYPCLIAGLLGIKPFGQPLLKGDLETYQAGYIGNPPNLELVLRRAESRLSQQVLAALREHVLASLFAGVLLCPALT
jgi:hypothetical protein